MKTIMRIMVAVGAIAVLSACSGSGSNNNNAASNCYSGVGTSTYYTCAANNGVTGTCTSGYGWSPDKATCLQLAPCAGAQYQTQYGANPSLIYGLFPPTNTCWPVSRVF